MPDHVRHDASLLARLQLIVKRSSLAGVSVRECGRFVYYLGRAGGAVKEGAGAKTAGR